MQEVGRTRVALGITRRSRVVSNATRVFSQLSKCLDEIILRGNELYILFIKQFAGKKAGEVMHTLAFNILSWHGNLANENARSIVVIL